MICSATTISTMRAALGIDASSKALTILRKTAVLSSVSAPLLLEFTMLPMLLAAVANDPCCCAARCVPALSSLATSWHGCGAGDLSTVCVRVAVAVAVAVAVGNDAISIGLAGPLAIMASPAVDCDAATSCFAAYGVCQPHKRTRRCENRFLKKNDPAAQERQTRAASEQR